MRQIKLFIRPVRLFPPIISLTLTLLLCPFLLYAPLNHTQLPYSVSGGDNKGQPDLLLILIFPYITFYQHLMMPFQRLLGIIIDSLPMTFQQK